MDIEQFPLLSQLKAEDYEEVEGLLELGARAKRYLESHRWCDGLRSLRFGDGVPGVVGVFLARPSPVDSSGLDEWLWVVVGDLPSAYLVTDQASTPSSALRLYADLMDDWAKWVLSGAKESENNVFPVKAERTEKHATMLMTRTKHLREVIAPWMDESSDSD